MSSVFAFIMSFLTFLKELPAIIKVVKEVISLIEEISDKVEKKKQTEKIADAIKHAKETKDTSKIEDLFGPKSFSVSFKKEIKEEILKEEKKSIKIDTMQNKGFGINFKEDNLMQPFEFSSFASSQQSVIGLGASFYVQNRIRSTQRLSSDFILP